MQWKKRLERKRQSNFQKKNSIFINIFSSCTLRYREEREGHGEYVEPEERGRGRERGRDRRERERKRHDKDTGGSSETNSTVSDITQVLQVKNLSPFFTMPLKWTINDASFIPILHTLIFT